MVVTGVEVSNGEGEAAGELFVYVYAAYAATPATTIIMIKIIARRAAPIPALSFLFIISPALW